MFGGCVLRINIVGRRRCHVFHLFLAADHRVPMFLPDSLLDAVEFLLDRFLGLFGFSGSLVIRFSIVRLGLLEALVPVTTPFSAV